MLKVKLLTLFISILSAMEVFGVEGYTEKNNWELIDETDTESYYYDLKSVTRPSKNIVHVAGKIVSESGEIIDIIEINCEYQEFRILSYIEYTADGKVLTQQLPLEWEPITTGSASEALSDLLCVPP